MYNAQLEVITNELIDNLKDAQRITLEKNRRQYVTELFSAYKGNWIKITYLLFLYFSCFLGLVMVIGLTEDNAKLFLVLWLYLPLGIFFFPGIIRTNLIRKQIIATIKSSVKSHILLLKNLSKVNTPEEMITKLSEIQKIIDLLIPFLKKNKLKMFNSVIKKELSLFTGILTDLRSDLQIRLAEQQKTLEQAKDEVEQTIKGTTELNQVSELQQARLDRQIKQFEELQKILVKV